MSDNTKKIASALISVYNKDVKIEALIKKMAALQVKLYSTGGTYKFIKSLGIECMPIEELTTYPSILGGRVKTLHPKVFGGILSRRDHQSDADELRKYDIPEIDAVIVDLYPFEQTVNSSASHEDIIEKIDIGGISLIRAAAKNYKDVLVVPSYAFYDKFLELLESREGLTDLKDREYFAMQAFNISSSYDTAIFNYFNKDFNINTLKLSETKYSELRYGENPHQKARFYGDLNLCFTQLWGKALSYNNIVDIDAAFRLISDFTETTIAIIKHTNACGVASADNLTECWNKALQADPVSAYGGIIIANREIDILTATEINKLFFEIIIAPGYDESALELLKTKKNRMILKSNQANYPLTFVKSALNGYLQQDYDTKVVSRADFQYLTDKQPSESEIEDLLFANIIVKHNKSNSIVLVKDKQLAGIGTGQTSRVDATGQAIAKAIHFGFNLQGAVMASDAFFPFPDCAQLAKEAGITAIIQPGGSIRDKDSIDYCNNNNLALVFTGFRHFKH